PPSESGLHRSLRGVLRLEILDCGAQSVRELYFGLPTEQPLGLANIRTTAPGIVLRERFKHNRLRFRKIATNSFSELQDCNLQGISNIYRQVFVRQHQPVNSIDQVRNVTKTSSLFSIAIHGNRLAAQRLEDKVRQRSPVVQSHSRPISIENAHDAGIQSVVA